MSLSSEQVEFIAKWQTLIAGGLAIAAAILGGLFVIWQTAEMHRQHTDQRRRERRAARAVMPLVASEVTAYARRCLVQMVVLRENDDLGSPSAFGPIELSRVLLDRLEHLVERLNERQSRAVEHILVAVQVQSDRFLAHLDARHYPNAALNLMADTSDRIVDAAAIAALSGRLYAYGRGASHRVELGPLTQEEVLSAMNQVRLDGIIDSRVNSIVRARYLAHPARFRLQRLLRTRVYQRFL